jgi:histidinol-phosphate aminotransferase
VDGRPVVVARTFSKVAGLAGMRLGYAIAAWELMWRIRPYGIGSINAAVKWGGVAALKDVAWQERVKTETIAIRDRTAGALSALGYEVIPSQTNFLMVHVRRKVQPVISQFRKRGVLVGRPFPPMNEHLRVSIGTADEMKRFVDAFREIVSTPEGA